VIGDRDPHHRRGVLLALVVTVLWSSSWVIIRFGLDDEGLRPLTFAGMRYGVAAVILGLVVVSRAPARRAIAALGLRELGVLAALGVVFYTLTQGAQFVALDNQPAATTSLVLSMTPLVVAVIAGRSLGERPRTRQVIGGLLVAGGATLYFAGSLRATAIGMAAAGVALASNVGASLIGRLVNRNTSTRPLVTTTVSMAIGAALLSAIGLGVEGIPAVSVRAAVIVGWLAAVNTALAFTLWNHSLRHLSATESAVINNTMLIQIALLAWLFLGETPGAVQIVGITLVTAGIIGSQLGSTITRSSAYERRDAAGSDSPR
jgi:drug/metabolite transporter (DMT)-like permease